MMKSFKIQLTRELTLYLVIVFIFAVLVLRLGYLQIAQGSHYKQIIKMMKTLQ